MPEPTIKDLYKQLSRAETRTAAHVELNWAIEELERAAEPFRRFLGRKQLPTVKAADRENLMRLHREIGLKAEALLAGNDRPAVKELVRKGNVSRILVRRGEQEIQGVLRLYAHRQAG